MAGGDVQIAIPNGAVPKTKRFTGNDAVDPKSISAIFDGSAAAVPFLPCLRITGKEGRDVAVIPAPQMAAGASAEVSWFPRVAAAAKAVVFPDTPFVGVELQDPASPLVAGAYAPVITAIHPNGPGAPIFSVNPGSPTFLQVAEAGIYAVSAEYSMSNPFTLPIGGFVTVQVVTTGQFGTIVRNVFEIANTVATKRIQEAQGVTFTHFNGADTLRYVLRTNQTMSNVGPLGYAVWRIAKSYQP